MNILSGIFNFNRTKRNNVVFNLRKTLKLFELKVGNDIKPTRDMETKSAWIDFIFANIYAETTVETPNLSDHDSI